MSYEEDNYSESEWEGSGEEPYEQLESCDDGNCGVCFGCEAEKSEYMSENFPDAWEEDIDPSELMDEGTCLNPSCDGCIELDCDSTNDDVWACSSCGGEYRHCGTCNGYYSNREHSCPNDC